jgi:polysaccharide biosynthesis/export protein
MHAVNFGCGSPYRSVLLCAMLQLFAVLPVFCQPQVNTSSQDASLIEPNRVALAISSQDYPVTPGDMYHLTFYSGGEVIANDIIVESDYNVNLGIFKKISTAGKSFPEIKKIIESRISSAYPESMPSISILSVGLFLVQIKGEISESQSVIVWGLSRLNDVISKRTSPYSSMRQVGVLGNKGTLTLYDPYKAIYDGDLSQNPHLKPGDTIVLYPRGKLVEIQGAVERPGAYQILSEETFSDIIERYAKGFSKDALKTRISILRYRENKTETIYIGFDKNQPGGKTELSDGDVINVPALSSSTPVIYIEGAIIVRQGAQQGIAAGADEAQYNRITYSFSEGETVYDAVNKNRGTISPLADLKNAYVIDGGTRSAVRINLEELIYNYKLKSDRLLRQFDTIVIPINKTTISVQGDVRTPGEYAYNPSRDYRYYIDLAGGLNHGTYEENTIKIRKGDGIFKELDSPLFASDAIEVRFAKVSVIGAVNNPGIYPYVKGKKYSYYTTLAGGIVYERNADNSAIITDINGKECDPKADIRPDDVINIPSNAFEYNFNRYAPMLTTTLSLATTVITLIILITNLQAR